MSIQPQSWHKNIANNASQLNSNVSKAMNTADSFLNPAMLNNLSTGISGAMGAYNTVNGVIGGIGSAASTIGGLASSASGLLGSAGGLAALGPIGLGLGGLGAAGYLGNKLYSMWKNKKRPRPG